MMTSAAVEYATEEERDQFILAFCKVSRHTPVNRNTALLVVVQLIAEEDESDLSGVEDKHHFAVAVQIAFELFDTFVSNVLAGLPLLKVDYLTYMGALLRTMSEDRIKHLYGQYPDPNVLTDILEVRNFKRPQPTRRGLYEGLGLVDPARTRRPQHPSLSQTHGRRGRRGKNLHNN